MVVFGYGMLAGLFIGCILCWLICDRYETTLKNLNKTHYVFDKEKYMRKQLNDKYFDVWKTSEEYEQYLKAKGK